MATGALAALRLGRHGDAAVARFLAAADAATPPHGVATTLAAVPPAGFHDNRGRKRLGHGEQDFARAVQALRDWRMFALPWTHMHADGPPRLLQTVACSARVAGLSWLLGCRVVDLEERPDCTAFTYAALPCHAAAGLERFAVERDALGDVWFDVRSHARPGFPARLCPPLFRALQRRFVADAGVAMAAAVQQVPSPLGTAPSLLGGALAWMVVGAWVAVDRGFVPLERAALAFAALVLLPLGMSLLPPLDEREARWRRALGDWPLLAAAALAVSLLCWNSPAAIRSTALIWTMTVAAVAVGGALRLRAAPRTPRHWAAAAALIFPLVGGGWLLAAVFDRDPLGFADARIPWLTAVHFHHAGFALPLAAALCVGASSTIANVASALILAGVPLVAAGITATQLQALPWLEPAAVLVTAAGALLVAAQLLGRAVAPATRLPARALCLLAGLALLASMSLAVLYGIRRQLPGVLGADPVGWMIGTHGLLNAFVFAPCVLLGFRHQAADRAVSARAASAPPRSAD